jgi:predicted histidine transporter YuiF (NhaC family)
MSEETIRRVDQSALRVNQAFIISLLILAFVMDSWPLAAFVGLVMLLGTAAPPLSLFKQIYLRGLRPTGLVKPDVIADNPEPHRFAQGLGSVFLSLAVAALLLGQPLLGWGLVWLVIVLAALNLFLGFCAGCFVYYQLNRLHVPGFEHSPVE